MNLELLRRTAAEIAAAAVYEIYPEIELLGGGETPLGFTYDFRTPHPVQLALIEEQIRQIIREKRPIRTLEMVPFSAAELLRSQGHHTRAEQIEGEPLVELIQIGSFSDLSSGPHLKNTAELAAFKISLEPQVDCMRIVGWCHTAKDTLRKFLKKLDAYTEPSVIGERLGYWKGPLWLPKGLELRRKLLNFLKKQWFEEAYEVSAPQGADRTALHRSLGKAKVAEVVSESQLQISFFKKPTEAVISSLHSIGKTLTILGFDHTLVSRGRESEYVVEDQLGRAHALVSIQKLSADMIMTIAVEKMFLLLLEKNLVLQMVELENQ